MDKRAHADRLLAWYDGHARHLPWRVAGVHPQPYHVWLSEIMLQQTVVKTVIPYFDKFTRKWPHVEVLAAADLDDVLRAWAGLGYYARARNLHACANMVAGELGGRFPQDEAGLLALPGVGPYTAAAIAAIAFDQPATVVDGNVERVAARLFALHEPLPGVKLLLRDKAGLLTPGRRPGDYAQAMMDLGATICTPKRPACGGCPLSFQCKAHADDCAEALPVRAPRKPKPLRRAVAFVAERDDGAVLLRRRPDKGLLAKMMEVPSTPWWREGEEHEPIAAEHAPFNANWKRTPGRVDHIFTHFRFEVEVWQAKVSPKNRLCGHADPARCRWVPRHQLADEALPSIMRKLIAHAGII